MERRAHRTGSARWALRVLVVGGLAGAAWLLTGAAAQAADRADVPVGSLLGSVTDGSIVDGRSLLDGSGSIVDGGTTTPVRGVLKAAAQPLEAARPAVKQHHLVDDVADVPRRVIARPADTLGRIVRGPNRTTVDAATGGVDHVLRDVAGPIRLTGGPANAQQRLTTATDDVVTALAQPDVLPAPSAPATPDLPSTPAMSSELSMSPKLSVSPMPAVERPHETAVARLSAPALSGTAQHPTDAAHAMTAGPETATEETPGGDDPAAPLRLHLGDVSGTPTSGSGTRTEGGTAAFLPVAIAGSTMAWHPLPIASDVEVRRHDAEAPTASPD